MFSGSVVPILNKLLVSAQFGENGQNSDFVTNSAMPSIVKVEPTQLPIPPHPPIDEPQQAEEVNDSFKDGKAGPVREKGCTQVYKHPSLWLLLTTTTTSMM